MSAGLPGLSRPTRLRGALSSLERLEEGFGGRSGVIDLLSGLDTLSDDQKTFLRLLTDPSRASDSLVALCADVPIAPSTLIKWLRDAGFSHAVATAQLSIAQHLPDVVESVAHRAIDSHRLCVCTNGGLEPPAVECPKCRGKGEVFVLGSLEHQRMLLEASQLLAKGGVNVNVTQQNQTIVSTGVFDKFVKGASRAVDIGPFGASSPEKKTNAALPDPAVIDVP